MRLTQSCSLRSGMLRDVPHDHWDDMHPISGKERRSHTGTPTAVTQPLLGPALCRTPVQVWWWDCSFAACARPVGSQAFCVASSFSRFGGESTLPPQAGNASR